MTPSSVPPDRPLIVLTGVTGGLGSELLSGLLRAHPAHHVVALVRAADADSAAARVAESADHAGLGVADRRRVHALQSDLSAMRLGLDADTWHGLAAQAGQIYHLAASVDFDLPLAESRAANVDSTREVLALARECMRRPAPGFRLHHVSTAYVVGQRRGPLLESELQCGQPFWNAYEQSKLESELLVRQAMDELPATIYRPSQVIGHSRTGRTRKYFGFYEFVRLAERGKMRVLLADEAARSDMVCVDFVCAALLALGRQDDSVGRTFHLCAGLEHSASVAQVVDKVFGLLRERALQTGVDPATVQRPQVLPADMLASRAPAGEVRRFHASALKLLLRTYGPYLAYERDFDVADTHARLRRAGVSLPEIDAALGAATRYALSHRFGDQPTTPFVVNTRSALTP